MRNAPPDAATPVRETPRESAQEHQGWTKNDQQQEPKPVTSSTTREDSSMPNACSMTTRRAPFCPSCGEPASHWSEFRETTGDGPITTNALVQFSWICTACHFDVTVSARTETSDAATEPVPASTTDEGFRDSFDAREWARAFMRRFESRRDEIDESLMLTWFANAMMRGYDERRGEAVES